MVWQTLMISWFNIKQVLLFLVKNKKCVWNLTSLHRKITKNFSFIGLYEVAAWCLRSVFHVAWELEDTFSSPPFSPLYIYSGQNLYVFILMVSLTLLLGVRQKEIELVASCNLPTKRTSYIVIFWDLHRGWYLDNFSLSSQVFPIWVWAMLLSYGSH